MYLVKHQDPDRDYTCLFGYLSKPYQYNNVWKKYDDEPSTQHSYDMYLGSDDMINILGLQKMPYDEPIEYHLVLLKKDAIKLIMSKMSAL